MQFSADCFPSQINLHWLFSPTLMSSVRSCDTVCQLLFRDMSHSPLKSCDEICHPVYELSQFVTQLINFCYVTCHTSSSSPSLLSTSSSSPSSSTPDTVSFVLLRLLLLQTFMMTKVASITANMTQCLQAGYSCSCSHCLTLQ